MWSAVKPRYYGQEPRGLNWTLINGQAAHRAANRKGYKNTFHSLRYHSMLYLQNVSSASPIH